MCAGAIFLILFIAQKYLFNVKFSRLFSDRKLVFWRAFSFMHPPNLKFALSLSQLGVIRI